MRVICTASYIAHACRHSLPQRQQRLWQSRLADLESLYMDKLGSTAVENSCCKVKEERVTDVSSLGSALRRHPFTIQLHRGTLHYESREIHALVEAHLSSLILNIQR